MSTTEVDRLTDRLLRGAISRRQFLARGAALGVSATALGAILDACGSSAASTAKKDLSVLGWGGSYGDALKKWVSQPFEAANNATVTFQEQAKAADSLARIQAQASHPTVDVWLTTGALPLLLAKSGGLQELRKDVVTNLPNIVPSAVQTYQGKTYGAGIHLGAECILVDNKRIKQYIPDYNIDMLKSWTFLYRPELKNKIAVAGFSSGYGGFMIGMSKPYGGSENDEEKFFAAMKKLAPNVHTVPAGSSYVPLFLSKEIVASQGTPPDATDLIKNGATVDIGYPLDPLEVFLDYIVAVKNGPAGGDLALKYINQILDPTVMTNYDGQLGYNSPNSKSVQPVPSGQPPLSPDDILKNGWLPDYNVAIANYDAWNQRFQEQIVPLFGK